MGQHLVLVHQESDTLSWPVPPLQNRTLASYIKRHQKPDTCRLSVLDFVSTEDVQTMFDKIVQTEPDVVGLSVCMWNSRNMYALTIALKDALPNTMIVLGGPHLWLDHEDMTRLFADVPMDYVIQGEGEVSLLELMETPVDERPPRGVIAGKPIPSLDDIGGPLLDDWGPLIKPPPIAVIEGSRGCKYPCAFCANNLPGKTVRRRSDEVMIGELQSAERHGASLIMHLYAYFNQGAEITYQRLAMMERADLSPDITHTFALDYFSLTEPEVAAISKFNAVVDIGLQTITKAALRYSRRGFPKKKFESTVAWCKEYGVPLTVELIMGLPGEDYDGFMNGLDYVSNLDLHFVVPRLVVLPGTELYKRRKDLGLVYDPVSHELIRSPYMTEDELDRAEKIAWKRKQRNKSPVDEAVRAALVKAEYGDFTGLGSGSEVVSGSTGPDELAVGPFPDVELVDRVEEVFEQAISTGRFPGWNAGLIERTSKWIGYRFVDADTEIRTWVLPSGIEQFYAETPRLAMVYQSQPENATENANGRKLVRRCAKLLTLIDR